MPDATVWVAMVTFIAVSTFSPGPNNLLSAANGATHGWRGTQALVWGMIVGFTTLHLLVGVSLIFLSESIGLFEVFSWVGAAYILWLAWQIATSGPASEEGQSAAASRVGEQSEDAADAADGTTTEVGQSVNNRQVSMGFRTGTALQLVNGKGWIHYTVLMGTFVPEFGGGIPAVLLISVISVTFGASAVHTWAAVGGTLRGWMADPKVARVVNGMFALALVAIALSILFVD